MDDLGTSYYDYYDDHEDYYGYDDGEDLGPMLNFNVTRNNEYLDIFLISEVASITLSFLPKIGLSFFGAGLEFFENGQKTALIYTYIMGLGDHKKLRPDDVLTP